MRLVYIWIESYNWIYRSGYMLTSAFRLESNGNELRFYKSSGLDPMLYGRDISVTAIVGNNGVGKSTLLDAIRIMLFDRGARKKIKGFLVFEDRGRLYIMSPRAYDIPFRIICREKEGEDILISHAKERLVREPFGNFGLVYYSDFLDLKYYDKSFDDQCNFQRKGHYFQENISTSWLLKESKNSVRDFFHQDIEKQIQFYEAMRNLEMDALPFPLPEKLYITIANIDINEFEVFFSFDMLKTDLSAEEEENFPYNMDTYVGRLLQEMENYSDKHLKERIYKRYGFDDILQYSLFTVYLYNTLSKYSYRYHSPEIDEDLERTVGLEKYNDFGECIRTLFSLKESNYDLMPYVDFYEKFKMLGEGHSAGDFHVILQTEREYPDLNRAGQRPEWNIKASKEQFFAVFKSYEMLTSNIDNIDFLHFSWGMSSGENAFFNLFARLDRALRSTPETENMILMFDELDSSFHPEWQQRILSGVTGFLRKCYRGRKIQVIITTHSPVVLSDVPRENVIFMDRRGREEQEHEQTFAANISSLYYDSFFMQCGSIGETARVCILSLLNAIADMKEEYRGEIPGQRNRETLEQALFGRFLKRQGFEDNNIPADAVAQVRDAGAMIRKLADSIGEPIWRHKVNERLDDLMRSCGVGENVIETEVKKMRSQMGDERFYELLMYMQEVES